MVHNIPPMVDVIGAGLGVLSLSIAIYFQLISNRRCPPKYVVLFTLVGAGLVMINSGVFIRANLIVNTLQVIAYLCIGIIEVIFAWRLNKRLGINESKESIVEVVTDD